MTTHALTIDVEDYHNVVARDRIGRDAPPTEAVVANTNRLLQILADHNVHSTCFILGEVARTFPQLIRDIASAGHELGVHGFAHRQVFKLTPDEFRKEVGDTKALIEDIAGAPANSHRAPAFSIMPDTKWALDVLAEVGFTCDSSIFPIAGRRYGWPGFPPDIHEMKLDSGRTLIEAPMSTVTVLGKRLPACGGGYMRHFPWWVTRWAMRRVQRERPAIVYMHPYEIELMGTSIDTGDLPPDEARRYRRFHRIQVRNRHTVEAKLLRLLDEFHFAPLGTVIEQTLRQGSAQTASSAGH